MSETSSPRAVGGGTKKSSQIHESRPRLKLDQVLRAWEERRLRLGDLSSGTRFLAIASLIIAIIASIFVVLFAAHISVLGGNDQLPVAEPVPRLMTIIVYVGLAVAAAIFTLAALDRGWRLPRFTLAAVGYTGLAIAGLLVDAANDMRRQASGRPGLLLVAGSLSVVMATAVAVAPRRFAYRWPWLLPALAAGPFLMGLVAYLTAGSPFAAQPAVAVATLLGFAVSFLLLWQAVEGVRNTRGIAVLAADRIKKWPWILGGILMLKLLWIGLGYTGTLPELLGGHRAVWSSSFHDGVVSWALTILFVGAGIYWLFRLPQSVDDRYLSVATWGLALALTIVTLLAMVVILLLGVIAPLHNERLSASVLALSDWLINQVPWNNTIVVWAALGLGLILLWWPKGRKARPLAVFLLVFAAWSVARAVIVTYELLTRKSVGGNPPGFVDVVTVDTVVTLAVAVLALLWWQRRQRVAGPGALMVILVASTLLAHHATVIPRSWGSTVFYLALLYPVAYQFLFDAKELNQNVPARSTRVLAATGLAEVVLTIVAMRLWVGMDRYDPAASPEPWRILFVVPFGAMLIAIYLSTSESPLGHKWPNPERRPRQTAE
jgi:hypothetical protein